MRLSHKTATLLVLIPLILLAPVFFPSSFYYRVGALIFINGLAVTGMVILIGYAGQISLGHAGFAGIGAYACALMPVHWGIHPLLAAVLGAAISAGLRHNGNQSRLSCPSPCSAVIVPRNCPTSA